MDSAIELVQVEKDGIIDYPLYSGQTLSGVWDIVPNPTGPSVTPQDGYLHYGVTNQPGYNQWLMVSIDTPIPTDLGGFLVFRVRANTIQGEEVKFTLAGDVILRFTNGGTVANWQWWDGSFHTMAESSIRANGAWHNIAIAFTPGAVVLFEDGNCLFSRQTQIGAQFSPVFHMQVLTVGSNLSFDVGDICSVPPRFAPGIHTPWDFSFNPNISPSEEAMTFTTSAGGPQVSFGSGYVGFAAEPMSVRNSWSFLNMPQCTPAVSILIYRIRVNASGGNETKITLPGGNILRLVDNGGVSNWQWWDGTFHTLAPSCIVAGMQDFTIVTLVTSPTQMALLENGALKFKRIYPQTTEWNPGLAVQHLDEGTSVSVDIGGIRTVPCIKPPALLANDLQDELLGYFPMMGDLTNVAGTSGDLTAIGGTPAYILGPFGLAANFSGQRAALQLPQLPTSTSPSYTLSTWVKVNNYPASGTLTGIAGTLLLNSAGHLQFTYVFNKERVYQEQVFTSASPLSTGQWHNVIVTYSYEESRLSIFIDGKIDSVFYLGEATASASAIVPAMFYVGGYKAGYNQPMVILDGAAGQLFFLTQHVHQPTAAMLASVQLDAGLNLIPLLPIFFIGIAAAVAGIGVMIAYLHQSDPSPSPPPTLDTVVSKIREKVGVPARKGAKVSRTELGLPDDYPILLDIGGEGPLNVGGLVTGFANAVNVNAPLTASDPRPPTVSVGGPLKGSPIPNLVELLPWDSNPGYPFADNFATQITMIGAPLTDTNIKEITRVVRDGGEINLWIDYQRYKAAAQQLAQNSNSIVEEVAEIPAFKNNGKPENQPGGTWCVRRRIIAHKRRVIFYATDFSNLDPLAQCANNGTITHVLVGLFHLGYDDEVHKTGPYIHLNNLNPNDSSYNSLWTTVQTLQNKGVRVLGSLGGGGVGDYGNLFANPDTYSRFYQLLKGALAQYNLDGLDLDIEENNPNVDTSNVRKLMADLRHDLMDHAGGFMITSAPVPSALTGGTNISPYVNYNQLIDEFDLYVLQFYNGFGNLNPASTTVPHYPDVVRKCGQAYARKLVAGILTDPNDGSPAGSGYNRLETLGSIIRSLTQTYPNFGGISGWTYQHALNSQGKTDPTGWATTTSGYLKASSTLFNEEAILRGV